MKVIIGSRVPPRVSMFDQRDWNGSYSRAMPPIVGDAQTLQAALLAKPRPVSRLLRMLGVRR